MNALIALAVVLALAAVGSFVVWRLLRSRNMELWIGSYLRRTPPLVTDRPVHVMFCFVDHFEPMWHGADVDTQRARVDRWCKEYRELAGKHRDADGRPPQHSFFYPEEEYAPEYLDKLAELCADGYGEIEVHLHHDNDTEENFRESITRFCRILHERHGAIPRDPVSGELRFGFIHGNWCLDNSRPDGRWCGINNELILLRELGCYADFTMPSAPSDTQTKTINSIYYASDDPRAPKSHDDGTPVRVGGHASGDLMLIQGPLGLNWRKRKFGVIPSIENADVRGGQPPSPGRVDDWVRTGVHVEGRPEWVFVKIHTHGTQEADMDTLLGAPTDAMHSYLEKAYNDGKRHVLHYVSAREAYNIAKAAEAGLEGNPHDYRDYVLPAPRSSWAGSGRQGGTVADRDAA
ncbi:hypothetical protein [Pseudoxanthomonas indica]|uniref:Uncharacterized protein n=1 Tax=Pseudoxanthomonas indica TaxID=428993 RepID=A0A1T5J264_9GAMM|nr:hypothetical protein [Pseudoxanthomonas indica]GGD55745.1 hypothetical protein GCM10007235_30170 [Pseudoxanthomonas indica]SKC45318.1 hypothetical protein SAMN06296058_0441 [Pseudoxanthomonas indica]